MIPTISDYVVVIDACVLLPISLTDLVLRLAESPALFSPRWSRDILNEVERNLQSKLNLRLEKARYRIACMESAFPEAMVTGYERFIDKMENHEKDRHVLAAALRAKADAILTANVKDFASKHLDPFGIECLTPDRFLVHQLHLNPGVVVKKLREQADDRGMPLGKLLELLGKMAPEFVEEVRGELP